VTIFFTIRAEVGLIDRDSAATIGLVRTVRKILEQARLDNEQRDREWRLESERRDEEWRLDRERRDEKWRLDGKRRDREYGDLVRFNQEMLRRNEIVIREAMDTMNTVGGELRDELRGLRSLTDAHTKAIWALIDRLNGGGRASPGIA
jgi:hypothetical protein